MIYLSHFNIYQYVIYVLNLITERRQYYRSLIFQDHFVVNYIFIINIRYLNLIVIFMQYNQFLYYQVRFILNFSLI